MKCESEYCPLTERCLSPNPTAVTLNHASNVGKADSSAGELGICVQSLEDLEKFIGMSHVKACTVISHKNTPYSIFGCLTADLDTSIGCLA